MIYQYISCNFEKKKKTFNLFVGSMLLNVIYNVFRFPGYN